MRLEAYSPGDVVSTDFILGLVIGIFITLLAILFAVGLGRR
ncbi:hypothetical protein ES702_01821 [subsurface metagenome]